MTFKNPSELYNFLRANNLVNLMPEGAKMVVCLDEYTRMCACDPEQARLAKYQMCKDNYINFAAHATVVRGRLFAATSDNTIVFYNGGQLICSLSR